MAIDLERHSRTIAAMSASSYDVLISASATEVLLLTGYWPVMAASVTVFSSDGRVQVIVPEDEVELAEKTSSAEILPYKPGGLHTLDAPLTHLKAPLRCALNNISSSISKIRVGVQLQEGVQPASYAVSTVFRSSLRKPGVSGPLFRPLDSADGSHHRPADTRRRRPRSPSCDRSDGGISLRLHAS